MLFSGWEFLSREGVLEGQTLLEMGPRPANCNAGGRLALVDYSCGAKGLWAGEPNYRSAAGPCAAAGARGPRIRASNSAVGQESAGSPYLICIAFTAVRLC